MIKEVQEKVDCVDYMDAEVIEIMLNMERDVLAIRCVSWMVSQDITKSRWLLRI